MHGNIIILAFILSGCKPDPEVNSLVNTKHLDSLFEEIEVDKQLMGIIHIYSEYPDYNWVGDDDEGIACVDDAARAAIFYLRHFESSKLEGSLLKAKALINFIIYMQAENGFYYNFIWEDHSINKDFKTSKAEPNWWAWRAMWSLSEADPWLKEAEP